MRKKQTVRLDVALILVFAFFRHGFASGQPPLPQPGVLATQPRRCPDQRFSGAVGGVAAIACGLVGLIF